MKVKRYKETGESKQAIGKGIVSGSFTRYPAVTQLLHEQGLLEGWPTQVNRTDLEYDEGIDIIYRFRRMTPARFKEYSDALLLAAFTEADRYKEEKYKFGKFVVKLNRNDKGRKAIEPSRTYTCAKHTDAEVMVYGKEALGYTPTYFPHGGAVEQEQRSFLINKVEDILQIPDTTSPGAYVDKQKPYTVASMTIGIRAGLREAKGKSIFDKAEADRTLKRLGYGTPKEIQSEDDLQ